MASAGARWWSVMSIMVVWGGVPNSSPGAGGQSALKLTDGKVFVFKAVIFDGSAAVLHEVMYYLYF